MPPFSSLSLSAHWIGLNRTTACLTGKAATAINRERLIVFLKDGMGPLPALVDGDGKATPKKDHEVGSVRVPTNSGSAFVRRIDDGANETLRLFWEQSQEQALLAVPVGQYELIGYCLYRSEEKTESTASAGAAESEPIGRGSRPELGRRCAGVIVAE
jgi:hypothetical protein